MVTRDLTVDFNNLKSMNSERKSSNYDKITYDSPKWIQIRYKIEFDLDTINLLYKRLETINRERNLLNVFDSHKRKSLYTERQGIIGTITSTLKNSSMQIKNLCHDNVGISEGDRIVLNNVKTQLMLQFENSYSRLKQYMKVDVPLWKEIEDDNEVHFIDKTANSLLHDVLLVGAAHDVHNRSVAIKDLVSDIEALSGMFRDLNSMIVEQGTVIDCIDHNITAASVNVSKGKTTIVETERSQDKFSKSCICILLLLFLILIMSIVLIVKNKQ